MKKFTLLLLALWLVFKLEAQHVCATDQMMAFYMKQNPEMEQLKLQFDQGFKSYLAQPKQNKKATKYIIPVVVHVFHNNGSENLSDATITTVINRMNQYFAGTIPGINQVRDIFKPLIADCEIEFRLAKKDPQGNCTNGIVRIYSPQTERGNDYIKAKSTWDTKRYMNIWVTQSVYSGQGNAVGGFSTLPFGGFRSQNDGIIVVAGQFASDNTGAHEAGHWLGLYHPFSGDSCAIEGDGIDDTPPTFFKQSTNGVNTGRGNQCGNPNFNSCTSDKPDLPDMQENVMDYFGGSCSGLMFTPQQKARMQFCLENYRKQLWSQENLIFTGVDATAPAACAPIAAFNTKTPTICEGGNALFFDFSYNGAITSWNWEFEGGSPSTFTGKTPGVITYANPGKYAVKLTVTGPNGTHATTLNEYITVERKADARNPGWQTKADWYYQNNWQQEGWYFNNNYSTNGFVRAGASFNNIASMQLVQDPFNLKNSINNNFELYSPTFNFSGASNPYIALNYAFARGTLFSSPTTETLIIYSSTDCGKTWIQRALKSANNISTVGSGTFASTVNFIPAASEKWGELIFSGASFPKTDNVRFKIAFSYAGGNNFFLDNVRVGDGSPTGINNYKSSLISSVFPNPMGSNSTLSFNLNQANKITISLIDITGKQISLIENTTFAAGKHEVNIDKNELNLSTGLYLIQVSGQEGSATHKLLVQ